MSLVENMGGMTPADMAAVLGSNNGSNGFANGNDWWVILFLFVLFGGYGNNGFAGNGSNGLYPWMNQSEQMSNGFRDQMVNSNINQIQNGINAISNQINSGVADIQQSSNVGFNSIASQLASCCCENRLASADLKYTIATEACADRSAISDALNNVTNNMNAGFQSIKDMMCQQELDAERRENENLRTQLNMANLAASQNAQTAAIQAGQRALASEVEQYINPTPVPAFIVQNPNCCSAVSNCGGTF